MDFTFIATYRCNSKCAMCYVWQHPSRALEEVGLDVLHKIPCGIDNLNITGGEPTLRSDLAELVDVLRPHARTLEISSNGLLPKRLEPIVKKHPAIKIRFSLDGFGQTNDAVRGEQDGFRLKMQGLKRLQELGGCDLGFAVTIQDENAGELVDLYRMARELKLEMATSTLHNGYQFQKNDNRLYQPERVARAIGDLIGEMLRTNSVKDWFRAYLNLGLMERALGHARLIPCTAAQDFVFMDPWGDVYACNVRPDLKMGNLARQSWSEIYESETAEQVRTRVRECQQNCWMVGSARTAMRHPRFTRLPKMKPFMWVAAQKMRVSLGLPLDIGRKLNTYAADEAETSGRRKSFLGVQGTRRVVQTKDDRNYDLPGGYENR